MSIHSIKESFEEVPTKANSALNSQIAYYKLFIFRFIGKSSYGLITFFIVAFASLLVLFFLSFATAYAIGEALGSNALGFVIVGAFYILIAVILKLNLMTKNKTYHSFEEIDNDLKILRLEKEIDRLSLTQQVSAATKSLTLGNLLANTWFSFLTNEKRWLNLAIEYALFFLFRKKLK